MNTTYSMDRDGLGESIILTTRWYLQHQSPRCLPNAAARTRLLRLLPLECWVHFPVKNPRDDRSRLLTDQTRISLPHRRLRRRFPHATSDGGPAITLSGTGPSLEGYSLRFFLSRLVFLAVERPPAKRVSGCAKTRGVRYQM